MNKDWKYIGIALTVYIITLPLNGFLKLPFFGDKLQLPEIAFLILFVLTFLKVIKHKTWLKWQVTNIDKALILYGLALFISCFGHLTRASFFEMVGFVYLVTLYIIVNVYLIETKLDIRHFLVKNTQLSGILTAVLGLIGLIFLTLNIETPLVGYYPNYPILGDIYRVKALATEPIMLNSILSVFILVSVADILSVQKISFSLKNTAIILLMGCIMFFTFTKSIVMFAASVLIMVGLRDHYLMKGKNIIWGLFFIIFLFFSHFVFINKSDFEQNKYCHAIEKKPLTEVNNKYLLRTCYGVLKEANIIVFMRNPLIGIGGGNFTAYTHQLKEENRYPVYLSEFDPLSTYFGALSELGLVGLMALVYLYFTIGKTWKKIYIRDKLTDKNAHFWLLLGGVLLFMMAEGFVTDTMNFRHYWLILACLAAQERITNRLMITKNE